MGLLNLTESERLEILNLHNNARIIKEQATPATAPAAPMDDKSKIMAIQTALNTKYKANLKVDGILGQNTLTALSTAIKSKSPVTPKATGEITPPVAPVTPKTVIPGIPDAPNPKETPKTVIPGIPDAPNPTTGQPAAPVTAPAAPATQGADEFGAGAPQPQLSAQSQQALSGQLTPQQIRQQGRFDQRLARQARRNERRAGQQQ